jgi:hypothetical protein
MKTLRRLSMFLVLLLSVIAVYAGGIHNAKDLAAFAKAVNQGADISAWRNDQGAVCLEANIDMKKMKNALCSSIGTPVSIFPDTIVSNFNE